MWAGGAPTHRSAQQAVWAGGAPTHWSAQQAGGELSLLPPSCGKALEMLQRCYIDPTRVQVMDQTLERYKGALLTQEEPASASAPAQLRAWWAGGGGCSGQGWDAVSSWP